MTIMNLTEQEIDKVEQALADYDQQFVPPAYQERISIGIADEKGQIIAGLDATMTAFHILYVSTVFVAENHRRQGLGGQLIREMERRAKTLGAHTIRLDTFDWQGLAFYKSLGYQEVGQYAHVQDGYSEHFFVKFI